MMDDSAGSRLFELSTVVHSQSLINIKSASEIGGHVGTRMFKKESVIFRGHDRPRVFSETEVPLTCVFPECATKGTVVI